MFSLAAKCALLACLEIIQAARMPSREMVVWNQIRPGIVTLTANGRPTGVAALIDDEGYFVTHSSSILGSTVSGTTSQGKPINFTIVSRDRATMLVLLKTDTWESGAIAPFHSPGPSEPQSGDLIAVLPTGPMRMTYGSKHRLGVLNPSRRLVPLTEMRFEAMPQFVGGALIFSDSGELVGSLNATLGKAGADGRQNFAGPGGGGAGGNFGGAASQSAGAQTVPVGSNDSTQVSNNFASRIQYSNAAPSEMTVAYTVSTDFVRHVIDGFLSSSHSVEFAILGVFCTDAIGGGAQIQQVTIGSPADKAGFKPGDIIQNIASHPIPDQIAFATVMLQQKVGKPIPIMLQRGSKTLVVDVAPAKGVD